MSTESNKLDFIKLPENFHIRKYGIDVRLVEEDDTPFILSLRTNKWLTRYIHQTEDDEQKQRQWIRNYKLREKSGKEYYFIYSFNGVPFGMTRIYDIHDGVGTSGSWLCVPGTDTNHVISTAVINRDIMFEILGLTADLFDVRKGNKKVQRFHTMMGCVKTGETELDILYRATPESHKEGKNKMIKLLNIDE